MAVELEVLRTYKNGITYAEALKLVEKDGRRVPTNKEIDEIIQSKEHEKYPDFFPCLVGTYVDYNGEKCTVTENGKKKEIKLPLKNGWYEQDEFGIPSGKPSTGKDPRVRFLWRTIKYSGLLRRGFFGYGWGGRCGVHLVVLPFDISGVAVVKGAEKIPRAGFE